MHNPFVSHPLEGTGFEEPMDFTTCPYCGSTDLEGGSVTVEGNEAWQDVGCLDCGADWTDVWQASHREARGNPEVVLAN